MSKSEIENELLKFFLDCHEKGLSCPIDVLIERFGDAADKKLVERTADELVSKGLLKGLQHDTYGEITWRGVLETEKRRIISDEKIRRNGEIRFKILEIAADKYYSDGYGEFAEDGDFDSSDAFNFSELHFNMDFLEAFGMVKLDVNFVGDYSFRIEQEGLNQFQTWKSKRHLADEFNRISEMKPQARGIELQKLIAKTLEITGWQQEESVKTSHEEIDVVIFKNREIYLIECKWESKPVQPIAINHLLSKLNKRADTKGIVISMSGFTGGAAEDVEDSTNQKLILLFGSEDVKEIISNPDSFEAVLDEKYKELALRRKAVWK